jgi:phage terminase large subunit-like protein
MLITSEIGLASKQLEQIKAEIERNDVLYERLYPRTKELWNSEAIRCKNGAMLSVKSYGSKMRGWHPDWITVDDFLTDQALYSQMQRNKYIDFFHSVVMNMLVPKGRIVVVGTPYHSADLYGNLKKAEGWRVFDYPAIFPDGSLLWQNRHNFTGLMGKRKSQGPIIFSREILVKPVSSDSAILPYETVALAFKGMEATSLVPNIWSHPKRKDFVRVVTGCDFARSAKVGADYSVFITLGIDEQDRYHLLHVWRKRGASFSEQIAAIRNIHTNFKPDLMVMESVQMQQLFVDAAKDLNIPVEGHATSAQSKYDLEKGVPSLVILFEQERFRFPRGDEHSRAMTDTIAMELASITWTDKGKLEGTGDHDDCGMALWMAVQAARKGTMVMGFI